MKRPPSLRAGGLSVGYGEQTVLHEISLRIPRGEITVIVGPGGSGKTTLLRAFATEPTRRSGMWLRGEVERAERSASMWQKSSDAGEAVGDYIARACDRSVSDAVGALWGARWGHEVARHRQDPIGSLSTDARQLVRLTATLADASDCLLLDEPIDGLTEETQRLITARIRAQAGRATVVLVTHHVASVSAVADHVALIVEGRLVESAPRSAFFEQPQHARTKDFLRYGS